MTANIIREVLKGEPYGMKADIWSFGCIMHSLLLGKAPFQAVTVKETLRNIRNNQFFHFSAEDAAELHPGLRQLIEGCLRLVTIF